MNHPGISYTHLVDDTPLSAHVLKVNPEICRVLPVRALSSGLGRECLTSMAERYGALAALNGGYFMVGGAFDGKSQGALKMGSKWFASPVFDCSSVAWMHASKEVLMSRIGMVWSLCIDGMHLPVDGLNMPLKSHQAMLYTSALHASTLSTVKTLEVSILDDSVVAVGRIGNAVIPVGGYIYSIGSDNDNFFKHFSVGMPATVSWRIGLLNERFEDTVVTPEEQHFWHHCDYIMSGAPLLIQNGIRTVEYEHDRLKEAVMFSQHPRSAVGVTANGEWVLVVVEGRQPHVSVGMDTFELAEFMEYLGCVHALNLDGGGSCLMLVGGQLMNTPIFNGIEYLPHEVAQRRISDAFIVVERT